MSVELRKSRWQVTLRELEILEMLASGLQSSEIAEELSISKKTVDFHARNILLKLCASTRAHAVALAHDKHIIDISKILSGTK